MATHHTTAKVAPQGPCTTAHGILQKINNKEDPPRRHGTPPQLKWDEASIAKQDKERGTRMKIDEPPTPYHRDHPDYKGVSAAALRERLEKVEVNEAGQALTNAELNTKKKEDFERRRRLHYLNERKASGLGSEEANDEKD